MYTTAKRLSIFMLILAIMFSLFNVGIIMLETLTDMEKNFALGFCKLISILACSATLIILTASVRSMCADLELEYEAKAKQSRNLTKRIEELERKIEKLQNNA